MSTGLKRVLGNFRFALRAYLFAHRPVEVDDLPREQWPTVATDYRLFFPDSGTKMTRSSSCCRHLVGRQRAELARRGAC